MAVGRGLPDDYGLTMGKVIPFQNTVCVELFRTYVACPQCKSRARLTITFNHQCYDYDIECLHEPRLHADGDMGRDWVDPEGLFHNQLGWFIEKCREKNVVFESSGYKKFPLKVM